MMKLSIQRMENEVILWKSVAKEISKAECNLS